MREPTHAHTYTNQRTKTLQHDTLFVNSELDFQDCFTRCTICTCAGSSERGRYPPNLVFARILCTRCCLERCHAVVGSCTCYTLSRTKSGSSLADSSSKPRASIASSVCSEKIPEREAKAAPQTTTLKPRLVHWRKPCWRSIPCVYCPAGRTNLLRNGSEASLATITIGLIGTKCLSLDRVAILFPV